MGPFYVKVLVRALKLCSYRLATVSEALETSSGRFACLTFDIADDHLMTDLMPALDRLRVPATVFVPTAPRATQVGWGALRALMMKGWEVGSLGHDGDDLTQRSSSEQRRSIHEAKTLLTAHLGLAPKLFAYPFGAYDATTVSCVKDAGFRAAITLKSGSNEQDSSEQSPYHLRRLPFKGYLGRDLLVLLRTVYRSLNRGPAPVLREAPARDRVSGVGL